MCDNKYQGIVPVPPKIGNGQDVNSNLYWGCGFGVRSYFKKSADWQFIKTLKPGNKILERLVFKHRTKNTYLVADAYDGQFIKDCTLDFLRACSGQLKDTICLKEKTLGILGHSKLITYTGHDGLMDFELSDQFANTDGKKRDCIILACYSKHYFGPHIKQTLANPLVWTTGLMCPETYTLHDAITGYLNKETKEQIRTRAALAYHKFQKCGEKAARNLLVSGW
ncbi:MAG: hypothetical protein IT236_00370 [Bacteroidia bacterium]|nr:hypothetical protein [Bacteroidia bacterium]